MKYKAIIAPNLTSIILTTLVLSGGLRIVTAGYALAEEGEIKMPAETEMAMENTPMLSQGCGTEADKNELLRLIREREQTLDKQEMELRLRKQDLAVSEKLIREQLVKLEAAEESLSKTLALADNAAENDISQLTSVYQNMKPKSAAQVFEGMDPRFAAGFLMAMRPESAAAIMSSLSAEKAYSVSVLMAARNARAPKE